MLGTVALVLLMQVSVGSATPICRWVNNGGRTQMASVVPDKYKAVANCTDSQAYELSAEQRLAAEQAAARNKARARAAAARPPAVKAARAESPAPAAVRTDLKRPQEVITDSTDCKAAWRIYAESVECFGPYRTAPGATRPEGFDRCKVVISPESRCGPPSN